MKLIYIALTVLSLVSTTAFAQENPSSSAAGANVESSTTYSEYYSFDENSEEVAANVTMSFASPQELFSAAYASAKKTISLLKWMLHANQMPQPTDPYQRVAQFGRWINDPTDSTCMNTRAKVLVRDSGAQVTFRNNRNCVVDTGFWVDPYAGAQLKSSREIQIDHVVPLKHAYISGAWKWDYKTRCLYANFMGANYHLLSVSGHENMSKGDRAPDAYVPPETGFRCEYLQAWLKVKAIWKLSLGRSEALAIQKLVRDANCHPSDFTLSTKELNATRAYIQDNINYCALNDR